MKRKLLTLFLAISMLAMVAWTPPAAECFGCTAAQKQQCRDEADRVYEECTNFYWPFNQVFCYDEAEGVEYHCLITKGCPVPVRNP